MMEFKNRNDFLCFLKGLKFIGAGTQGVCYSDINGKVYKIFRQYLDQEYLSDNFLEKVDYQKEDILKFGYIKNNTFKWPEDVVIVLGEVVGYIGKFVQAKPLYNINPLNIDLDKFVRCIKRTHDDLSILSKNHVLTYDLMYNIMYGNHFYVTDCDEFSYSNRKVGLDTRNIRNFDMELYYFLIDNYFDEFINEYSILKKMYLRKDTDILYFIELFRKKLSEYLGVNVNRLSLAKKCLNKNKLEKEYLRGKVK